MIRRLLRYLRRLACEHLELNRTTEGMTCCNCGATFTKDGPP